MGIEAMAEAAKLLFPERYIGAIENINFLAPFKFYRGQPRSLTVHVFFQMDREDIVAECRLIGSRTLHGHAEPEVTTHFTARVRLTCGSLQAEKVNPKFIQEQANKVGAAQIYKVFFHGPAYQVIDSAWRSGESVIAKLAGNLPANHMPSELPVIASPRFVELCFQTGSLSGLGIHSRLGLPYAVGNLKLLSAPEKAESAEFYAVVLPKPDGTYDAKILDEEGNVYLVLRSYRTMDLPDPIRQDLVDPIALALKA